MITLSIQQFIIDISVVFLIALFLGSLCPLRKRNGVMEVTVDEDDDPYKFNLIIEDPLDDLMEHKYIKLKIVTKYGDPDSQEKPSL